MSGELIFVLIVAVVCVPMAAAVLGMVRKA